MPRGTPPTCPPDATWQVRELEASKSRLLKAESDLKEQLSLNASRQQENAQVVSELRRADSEIAQLNQEVLRATKAKDGLLKRLKAVEEERLSVQKEAGAIRSQAPSLEREIEIENKESAACKTQAAEVRAALNEARRCAPPSPPHHPVMPRGRCAPS